jgi:ElaB/YqjD/DUF883 family membrane-anchored ribosome-binding protein
MGTKGIDEEIGVGVSQAKATVGERVDEARRAVRGEGRSFGNKEDARTKRAREALGRAAIQARSAATDTYADLRRRAQSISQNVDPFVRQSPYSALGLSILAGLVLGMLFFGRGAKVIYVRPTRG